MSVPIKTYLNNNPPLLEDVDLNSAILETNNNISDSGQTLNSTDNEQTSKASSNFASVGDFLYDSGSANTYVLNGGLDRLSPTNYFWGMKIRFVPDNTNTGASTLNINGLGAKQIYLRNAPLTGSELTAGNYYELTYNGVRFDLYSVITNFPKGHIRGAVPSYYNAGWIEFLGGIECRDSTDTQDIIKTNDPYRIGILTRHDNGGGVAGSRGMACSIRNGTYSSSGTAITGTGTNFESWYTGGNGWRIWNEASDEFRRVVAFIDATHITIDSPFTTPASGEVHQIACNTSNRTFHAFIVYNTNNGETRMGFDWNIDAVFLMQTLNSYTAGYTKYRRIASFKTDASGNFINFTATETAGGGYEVYYDVAILGSLITHGADNTPFSGNYYVSVPYLNGLYSNVIGMLTGNGSDENWGVNFDRTGIDLSLVVSLNNGLGYDLQVQNGYPRNTVQKLIPTNQSDIQYYGQRLYNGNALRFRVKTIGYIDPRTE